MKGEVLPFYRNMEAQAGKATRAEKTAWLRKHFVFACGDTNDLGKIALNAMQCSFKVYGPAKDNSNEIYSFTAPCALSLKAWLNSNNDLYPRLSSYVGQNKE
ncbi:MAG: hypothetical protein Q4B28_03035 [bacterium]|nr:hypothetical protein [bacterium]